MSALLQTILLPLTALSGGILVVLSALLVSQKLIRNQRERASHGRRRDFSEAVARGEADDLEAVCELVARNRLALDDIRWLLLDHPMVPGDRERLLKAARKTILVPLLRERTSDDDPVERGAACDVLSGLGAGESAPDLERMIEDEDREVRLTAARGLARLGTDEAAWALVRALRDDLLPPERILEQLGQPYAAEVLFQALHLEQLEAVRPDIAEALGLAGDTRCIYAIAGIVRFGDIDERIKACRALGRIGRPEVVPILLEALADSSEIVRSQAARALRRIGAPIAVPALEARLADRSWWVRSHSADALRACGPAGRAALERATAAKDPYARDRAREALALLDALDDVNTRAGALAEAA